MIGNVVVDASVALAWVLPAEDTDQALALRNIALEDLQVTLIVPPNFWYEVANVLWVAVRRQRLNRHDALKAMRLLIDFECMVWKANLENCLKLSIEHDLAVYDTAYLDLAMEKQAALWTMDQALKRAAVKAGIKVLP